MGLGIPEIVVVGLVVLIAIGVCYRVFVAGHKWVRSLLVSGLTVLGCAVGAVSLVVGVFLLGVGAHRPSDARNQVLAMAQSRAAMPEHHLLRRQGVTVEMSQTTERRPPVVAAQPQRNQETLPEWITAEHNDSLRVVSSEQYSNPQVALTKALQKARLLAGKKFVKGNPRARGWLPNWFILKQIVVKKQHIEPIVRSSGEHSFTVNRAYLLVDLSPATLSQFQSIWKRKTKEFHRAWFVVLLVAVIAAVTLLAGFFRIDEWTKGRFRWPLVGATVAGLGLSVAIPCGIRSSLLNSLNGPAAPMAAQVAVPRVTIAPPASDELIIRRAEHAAPPRDSRREAMTPMQMPMDREMGSGSGGMLPANKGMLQLLEQK